MKREKLPKGLYYPDEELPEGREVVGEHKQLRAAHSAVNLLTQVRQQIEPSEMQELVNAVIVENDSGERSINIIQPVTLGAFTKDELAGYLKKLNEVWGSNHTIDELTPLNSSEEYYLIVVAGHRRMLAIAQAAEQLGKNIDDLDIIFNVEWGSELTFRKAIQTQYRENFHKKPESWEDAFAISAIFREAKESKEYETYADCARALGITEERVAKAHRFQTLPETTQQLVRDKALSYTRGLMLTELFAILAYDRCSERTSKKAKKEMATKLIQNKLYLSEAMEFVLKRDQKDLEVDFARHSSKAITFQTDKQLRDYIASIRRSILEHDQLMLIIVSEEEKRKEDRRKQEQEARQVAISALRIFIGLLGADQQAIKNEQKPVLTKNKIMTHLLGVVFAQIDSIDTLLEEDSEEAVAAAKRMVEELIADIKDNEVDLFTSSTTNGNGVHQNAPQSSML